MLSSQTTLLQKPVKQKSIKVANKKVANKQVFLKLVEGTDEFLIDLKPKRNSNTNKINSDAHMEFDQLESLIDDEEDESKFRTVQSIQLRSSIVSDQKQFQMINLQGAQDVGGKVLTLKGYQN